MKVVREGSFEYSRESVKIDGWSLLATRGEVVFNPNNCTEPQRLQVLGTILRHIAEVQGIDLMAESVSMEALRATKQIIRKAKKDPWWAALHRWMQK